MPMGDVRRCAGTAHNDRDLGMRSETASESSAAAVEHDRSPSRLVVVEAAQPIDRRAVVITLRDEADAAELLALDEADPDAVDAGQEHAATEELASGRRRVLRHLAIAAEFRDDITREHTDRVSHSAAIIASAYGLAPGRVRMIAAAAMLHDIGKIAIPERILLKPGRLNPSETELMRRHAQIGAAILARSDVPELVLGESIALSHHEHWDGSGYPFGLEGEAIPLAARIAAIADVFDALVHERPYKRAWSVEDAVGEIARQRGRQFEPGLVDIFLSLDHNQLVGAGRDDPAQARRAAIAAAMGSVQLPVLVPRVPSADRPQAA
jgi:putative two-component system response regulator